MRAHRLELYKRYNRKLLRALQRVYNNHLRDLRNAGVEEKKGFVGELQPILEKSAVIRKRLPRNYVPMQKAFKRLYEEIYGGKDSYEDILETGELKGIAAKEEDLMRVLEHGILHVHPPKQLFPYHDQRHEVRKLYHEIGLRIRRQVKRKSSNPFARTAAMIAVFLVMSSFTPILAQAANRPYTSEEKRKALFGNVKEEAGDVLNSITGIIERGGDFMANRIRLVDAEEDVAEEAEDEPTQQQRDMEEWIEALALDDNEVQGLILGQESIIHSGKALAATFKKLLRSEYKVAVHTYDSEKDTITIPLSVHFVDEVNTKLAQTERRREVNAGVGMHGTTTTHRELSAGLNEDGDFVVMIRETVSVYRRVGTETTTDFTTRQVDVVVMHLLQ